MRHTPRFPGRILVSPRIAADRLGSFHRRRSACFRLERWKTARAQSPDRHHNGVPGDGSLRGEIAAAHR